MGLFDLEQQFAFYGAYHSNPVNTIIQMIFVWPIVFTIYLLLYFTPPIIGRSSSIEPWDGGFLVFNLGFLGAVIFALYYVVLDRKSGSLAALLVFLCWVGSSALGHRLGFSLTWKVVLASL